MRRDSLRGGTEVFGGIVTRGSGEALRFAECLDRREQPERARELAFPAIRCTQAAFDRVAARNDFQRQSRHPLIMRSAPGLRYVVAPKGFVPSAGIFPAACPQAIRSAAERPGTAGNAA
jgi:hypothetical protein